ncbi:hypothetical protein N7481_002364 [Penicillium waksmanii]|uniref:uncharacterized protein n=1 Tax=Penicillium waksmanii TaxID=69791 RepID=UPI002548B0F2|nr:uncharacterized protein N7481_002364 [Penicillium waksmanii]KAJ5995387.1 hypothetical protein N7481_002364 [Penicillium waksmanii]
MISVSQSGVGVASSTLDFGSDLGYLSDLSDHLLSSPPSSLLLILFNPGVFGPENQNRPVAPLYLPRLVTVCVILARSNRSSHPELSPQSPPGHRPTHFSTMIAATKRKVLDGLNRRYIYGRVVGLPSSLPGLSSSALLSTFTLDIPALTRCALLF